MLVHELQAAYAAETSAGQSSEWVNRVPTDFAFFILVLDDRHIPHELGIFWQVEGVEGFWQQHPDSICNGKAKQ